MEKKVHHPETVSWIETLKGRILSGGEIDFDEAISLLEIEEEDAVRSLLAAAREINFHFNTDRPALCSLVNAKSYLCAEDCAFCAQSVRFDTKAERYPLLPADRVVQAAKKLEQSGVEDFCIVTSGAELSDAEFEQVLLMFRRLKKETALHLDGSLGRLSEERVGLLKEAGVRRINHNLQSSREFYPQIVSTHSYEERLESLKVLQAGGMEICSGGILGMGESRTDRIRLAFELKPYQPRCLPVNILNPRPGTPLENQPALSPLEILKTIAVFRFIHPRAHIKLAGGREVNLSPEHQETALRGGANGLIMGGYLTSGGNPIQKDFEMLERAGFKSPY